MPPRSTSQNPAASPSPRRRSSRQSLSSTGEAPDALAADVPHHETSAAADPVEPLQPGEDDIAASLSFREAQTALELSLAELQAPDLDVEEMAGLYRRASLYADRCEQLLQQVEQEVMQWDPGQPQDAPQPYQS